MLNKSYRVFLSLLLAVVGMAATAWADAAKKADGGPLNVLIITVDDMSADSVGAFGCKLPDTTPHIDKLAKEGLKFEHAHVQVGNCYPSRNVMWSGLYPHNNRVEGFYQVKNDYPVMADFMKAAGYYTAIRGKVQHSTPYQPYDWDCDLTIGPNGKPYHMKDVKSFRTSTEKGIREAQKAGKPFCLLINISDPHKPFYGMGKRQPDPYVPTRVFKAKEVPVPGFLPKTPKVRKELALYYSSVRRADDCVGGILAALEASGKADRTVVFFLSDHGMPLPFAKTQVYHHSSRTPWIVRWPGVTKPGEVDTHMISAVDIMPTLLDIVAVKYKPEKFDGHTFFPLLKGESQEGRDMVFKEYNECFAGIRNPMRAVETRDFLYIYNPWSNGKRKMVTATTGTASYRQMKKLAKTDPKAAARLDLFDHRVPQEFFCMRKDRDALNNLVDDPKYKKEVDRLRTALRDWMEKTGDPLLKVFEQRDNPAVSEAYMKRDQAKSDERQAKRKKAKRAKKKGGFKFEVHERLCFLSRAF